MNFLPGVREFLFFPHGGGGPVDMPRTALLLIGALTVEAAAERLGLKPTYVRKLVTQRKLPSFRIHGEVLIPADAVKMYPMRHEIRKFVERSRAQRR